MSGLPPEATDLGTLLGAIRWGADGLVPVVCQDASSGEVLTVAYANEEALRRTVQSGEAHYWSRSRAELWHKGATSGHVQRLRELRYDCDADALLYRVDPAGPACHTGERSCFHRTVDLPSGVGEAVSTGRGDAKDAASADPDTVLALLQSVVDQRLRDLPEGSYVAKLAQRGVGYVAQKVVEEAGETVVAALQQQDQEMLGEAADLLFHLTVLLRLRGLGLRAVGEVLLRRHAEHPGPSSGR